MQSVLAREESRHILGNAQIAHLGITAKSGPHVTPELFAWTAGRLWFATARRTLKARTLRTGDRVGVLAQHGPHRLVISGEARPLDGVRPLTFVMSPHEGALYPAGAAAFILRNVPHLAGFIAQGPHAFPRSLATFRMFIAVRPLAAVLLRGESILEAEGVWSEGVENESGDIDAEPFRSTDVPHGLGELVDNFAGDAVVALQTASGPTVLPASWDPDKGIALVSAELLEFVGAKEGGVAIEVDRTEGYAMEGKRGALLRGEMRISKAGGVGRIELDPQKLTTWRGMRTETVPTA